MSDTREDRGRLYVVGTPIGNVDDLSPRARDVLAKADVIAAEDTRHTRGLLSRIGVESRLIAYHEHNEAERVSALLEQLARGKSVALVSDAGTPSISDPGQALVTAAWAAGHKVVPIPGPSSVTAALSIAGYGGPGFTFLGYLPRKAGEMRRLLAKLEGDERPAVAFESPFRIRKSLVVIAETMPSRHLTLTRELTKIHEEVLRGTAAEVLAALGDRTRGEFTIVISGI